MWRAESLKAGAGSRSKAAKPRPHHPRLSATMLWARGEWVLLEWGGGGVGGGWVLSPWEPKTWCNRCHPSCCALASPASRKPNPIPAVLFVDPLTLWCQTPVHRAWQDPAWHMGRFAMLLWVCERFACLCPQTPKRSPMTPAPQRIPPLRCFLWCWCRYCWVFPGGGKKIGPLLFSGCVLLLHGFGVALKSFPRLVPLITHIDPDWLFSSASLYITVYWNSFWLLIFFILSFLCCVLFCLLFTF